MLRLRGLHLELGGTVLLDEIGFELHPGQCLALVGRSGSGKSLTARSLLGFLPAGAEVRQEQFLIGDEDARELGPARWRSLRGGRIALISQDALVSLDPLRRIEAEVAEAYEVHAPRRPAAAERSARVEQLLERVSMPEPSRRRRQYPHQLSGGLRQRALIAAGISADPAILIADEPTTALDAVVQVQVLEQLAALKGEGLALLLISHDLGAVAKLADRVAVMLDGRIVEQGETEQVLRRPEHPYTRQLLAAARAIGPRAESSADAGTGEDAAAAAVKGAAAGSGTGEAASAPLHGALTRTAPVLAAQELSKSYRDGAGQWRPALEPVSFALDAGAVLGVVGESGSGKSTLARLLLAVERPDTGTVRLHGEEFSGMGERRRRRLRGGIQLIQQDAFSSFDPRWSVEKILAEALPADAPGGGRRRELLMGLLADVELDAALLGRTPARLSGGQRQRVAIARALASNPTVLVCDEPVSALDAQVQAQVLALLERLRRERQLAIVFISHDLAATRSLADTLLVLREGRVLEQGPAERVWTEPAHPYTQELIAASEALHALR